MTGIFNTGTPVDEKFAFVSLDITRKFLDKGNVVNPRELSLADIYESQTVADDFSSWDHNAKSWMKTNPETMWAINVGGFWT